MSDPQADPAKIAEFLEMARPDRQFVLGAIPVEGGAPKVRTFEDAGAAADWAATMNADEAHNLYWTHNRLHGPAKIKPSEKDVAEVLFTHVDIDPRPPGQGLSDDAKVEWNDAERDRILGELRTFSTQPTFIVDSGGGFQSFWRLEAPLFVGGAPESIANAKAYNVGLRDSFVGADNCQSLDHLMRLVGTVNWPDEKKRKKGRKPRLATVVDRDGPVSDLSAFMPASVEPQRRARSPSASTAAPRGVVRKLCDITELDQWGIGEADRLRVLIVQGCDPDKFEGDRSKVVCDLCCNLHRRGVPAGLIVGIISDPTWAISEHVIEKGGRDTSGYAWRQVERAIGLVEADGEPFEVDKHGTPYPSQRNIRLALTKMGVRVRYDRFADRAALIGLDGFGPHLSDAAMTRMRLRVEEEFKLKVGKETFCDVVEDAARRDDFHPVVDYLDALVWDGTPRLDGWLTTYLEAGDNEYTRHVGTIMLVAAVRRVRRPGCKFDEMVVLESEQGKSKSSALSVLAVQEDWFSDDLPLSAEAKLVIERTQGRWIIEAGELSGMGRKGVEHLKAFLSRRVDRSRMAYGRLTHEAPRHFIVVGTTNDDRYLMDSTGNRRFWPVEVGDIDLDALARDRDQLWAEAAIREASGESIRLDRALWQAAAFQQEERRALDPFVAPLADLFRDLQGKVRTSDVWRFVGTPVGQRTPEQERRLGIAMRDLGFERTKARFGSGTENCYRRGNEAGRARRILVMWVAGENGVGGAWEAYLDGDDLPGRQEALDLERAERDDGPY